MILNTNTKMIDIDEFEEDVKEIFDKAIFHVAVKSKKIYNYTLLLAIFEVNYYIQPFTTVNAERKKINTEIIKLLNGNFRTAQVNNLKNLKESFTTLINETENLSHIDFFNSSNWSDSALKTINDIETLIKNELNGNKSAFNLALLLDIILTNIPADSIDDNCEILRLFYDYDLLTSLIKNFNLYRNTATVLFDANNSLLKSVVSEDTYEILCKTSECANKFKYDEILNLHLFFAYLDMNEGFGTAVFTRCLHSGASLKSKRLSFENRMPTLNAEIDLKLNKKSLSENIIKSLELSLNKSRIAGKNFITPKILFITLLEQADGYCKDFISQTLGFNIEELVRIAKTLNDEVKPDIIVPFDFCKTRILNYNNKDFENREIVNRTEAVTEILKIFNRGIKPNALIYGEKGVGKSTMLDDIVNGLKKNVNLNFHKFPVIYFNLIDYVESRKNPAYEICEQMFDYMNENPKRIYIIDDFYKFYSKCPELCKSRLLSNKFCFAGIINNVEYFELQKKADNLNDYFEIIELQEPVIDDVKKITRIAMSKIEKENNIKFEDGLLDRTVKYASDFLISERFPKKIIDLLYFTVKDKQFEQKDKDSETVIKIEDIAKRLANITKIPEQSILGIGQKINYHELLSNFHRLNRNR